MQRENNGIEIVTATAGLRAAKGLWQFVPVCAGYYKFVTVCDSLWLSHCQPCCFVCSDRTTIDDINNTDGIDCVYYEHTEQFHDIKKTSGP